MCGISGIVSPKSIDISALKKMTDTIRHRGPDGDGFALFGAEIAQADRERVGQSVAAYHDPAITAWGRVYPTLALGNGGHRRGCWTRKLHTGVVLHPRSEPLGHTSCEQPQEPCPSAF